MQPLTGAPPAPLVSHGDSRTWAGDTCCSTQHLSAQQAAGAGEHRGGPAGAGGSEDLSPHPSLLHKPCLCAVSPATLA